MISLKKELNLKIFELCSLRATYNWFSNKNSVQDTNISFQFETKKYQGQGLLIFSIYIYDGNSCSIFNFSYDESDILGISIIEKENVIHCSEVLNEEEFEARLFQIQTIIDTYDLDTDMYQTMRDLYRIYFREKYETVQ